ncbi:hypothetical protein SAMN05920897_108142 [Alkalispirochaeta americana]|uniref:Chordopoxvirus fusion protein n=1 Tax=Alkalispirochaeta americana TaxID=159291 RepID=A0A1N6SMS8_9SPIO|nr:OmpH family outer membrane protein [Alkalispirochaeta americana]SIQ42369.1 hypothetical protein SAMN05920897_108142 [Alkalispirochaeta americana]
MSTALEPRVSNLELSLKELAYAQLRTERSLEELSNELKDFKNEMKEFKDEMREFKDEMREFKDEMREFKNESRRQSREMNKRWGELANRLGTVIEDIVAPNIPGIMARYFGVDEPDLLMVRPRKKHPQDPGRRREFDVLAVAGNRIFLNETKSKLREQDVLIFAESYQEVTDYFPEYSGHEIIPIMSSLYLTTDQVELLTRHGIYALAMSDDSMDLLNIRELER